MRYLNFLVKNMREAAQQIDSHAVEDLAHHVLLRTLMIDAVNDLMLSQEGASGTHKTTRQIAMETCVSAGRIIHKDIQLKCVDTRCIYIYIFTKLLKYTVFHKIGTPLYFCNNFFKC